MDVREGGLHVIIPSKSTDGIGTDVFYNPNQELNRDVTVGVLRAYREREPRASTYLDAMAATGIRGVRAADDGWIVTCCDRDPRAVELCRENLGRNGLDGTVVHRDSNAFMHETFFDVVDIDPFGTPIPYIDAAFATTRNLVCVTATDTAPLCGAHLRSGIRKYGAVPRNTEYHAEMGLRILLSALARTAARYDVGVSPILSHARGHYVRTYLELDHRATSADAALDELGFLFHCEDCLHREVERGLIVNRKTTCQNCKGNRVLAAGPMWLGSVRNRQFVSAVISHLTAEMGTRKRADTMLELVKDEIDEPTHFDQHRLYKMWNRPAESMDTFIGALRAAGHSASRAHYHGTAFKTTASVSEIRAAVV